MTITLNIKPELEAELARQAAKRGVGIDAYAAKLLEDAAHVSGRIVRVAPEVVDACERLKTFGSKHGLSLGGLTIRELRHEARP